MCAWESVCVCVEGRVKGAYGKDWPSLGSKISTVAMTGNSITPITGSDNKIWKVSACSYFPSFSIRTRHVALVCPGLNWICRWDLPLKSSSFFALPSWVPIPERWRRWWAWKRRNRQEKQTRWVKKKQKTKERRQRKWQWKGDRRERETDDKQIRYSHPLMLFREVRKRVLCFYFFSPLITTVPQCVKWICDWRI